MRIDAGQEKQLLSEWIDFSDGRFKGDLFLPLRDRPIPPQTVWPEIKINNALENFDAMALQQYKMCSDFLARGSGSMMGVRPNYGSSIIPLLFGVEPFVMPEEMNTLPTSRPLNDCRAVRRLIDAGVPDLNKGYGVKIFEMAQHFQAIGRQYPKIGRYIQIYHPDTQGPFDICEVVWGSEIFMALYDEPALVKDLLELVTQTYMAFMRAWERIVPFHKDFNVHWYMFHKGNIFLRNDSCMNLSPQLYEEFVKPYDQKLLAELGGGGIHFCGRGDHYIEMMSQTSGLYAINLSQPHLNDMEVIFSNTVDKGINIVGLDRATANAALANGRNFHGRLNCKNESDY
jgi:hypothetical protein